MGKMVKKSFLFLNFLLVLLLLSACTGVQTPEETSGSIFESSEEAEAFDVNAGITGFSVGASRIDVTPKYAVPLHGYGLTTMRQSTGYLDEICATAIAISDGEGHTLIMVTCDNCNSAEDITTPVREYIHAETGIPEENILLSATHTHSSVDITSANSEDNVIKYKADYIKKIRQVIMEAIADRKPAKMYYGEVDLKDYNFVRHYFTEYNEAVGDNHGSFAKGTIQTHATEPNSKMYMLRFERGDAGDVTLLNFRAHPTLTGGSDKYDISADFIAPLRENIEAEFGGIAAYFQGEAGNMNTRSRIAAENPTSGDYREYGNAMSELVIEGLRNNMHEIKTGTISTVMYSYEGQVNHKNEDKLAQAKTITNFVKSTGDRKTALEMCRDAGLESQYEANAIISRSVLGKTYKIEIHATRIGDFIMVHAPLEIFDTNGTYVRENAPSESMFYIGYSNEHNFYLPSQYAYEYGCYESDTTRYAAGEGELLAAKFVELLKEVWE